MKEKRVSFALLILVAIGMAADVIAHAGNMMSSGYLNWIGVPFEYGTVAYETVGMLYWLTIFLIQLTALWLLKRDSSM